MNDFDKFDRDFKKHYKRTTGFIIAVFCFYALMFIAVLGGIGTVTYLLLKHYGIVG